ncbi:MAG: CocE/NonD family hydrolase [Rhodothermales bacterium]|mgnify:CR=1 FL=1|nr:CocE/NonD family hydrolase [Rhodothermales bacterium]
MNPTFRRAATLIPLLLTLAFAGCDAPEPPAEGPYVISDHYTKHEYRIPMRDGVHLYTAVYLPKAVDEALPFLVHRTPYSSGPYGPDAFPDQLGPAGSARFMDEGFIFVNQDVRGRFMSEGSFVNMTPACPSGAPAGCMDESTDMYDTVEWLLANVQPNNGRVGILGISYPGFYAAASIVNSHPAIRAASPQAPIADWFIGDDFHHNGAFYLQDGFNFFRRFEHPEPNPTAARMDPFEYPVDDAYTFFLDLGALPNANKRYFNHQIAYWDSMMTHGTYDAFWQQSNILPFLNNVTASVMTVAGLYDAEDPYGPIGIYKSIEERNPDATNTLVLGPWFHGGWVRSTGDALGNVSFEEQTAIFYQDEIDLPFFTFHLKDKGAIDLPEALAFASGSNDWHRLPAWPPPDMTTRSIYFHADGRLSFDPPPADGADSYASDPANPVPYTQEKTTSRSREYMVEDQRFVAGRPDVLVYQTEPLTEDITFAGPVATTLHISTTGTDADFIVKLIDVFPDDTPEHLEPADKYLDVPMAGYQMMVRGEVFRAKFRNSFETPEPLTPGAMETIRFAAPDIFHTFKAGHRIMVQIQSTWFPLVDRNPQQFMDIYSADDADFLPATHTVHRSATHPSRLEIGQFIAQ